MKTAFVPFERREALDQIAHSRRLIMTCNVHQYTLWWSLFLQTGNEIPEDNAQMRRRIWHFVARTW